MKRKKEPAKRIYLDDYILQKDMRVRMPKEIIKNMNVKPGESYFEVYFEPDKQEKVKKAMEDLLYIPFEFEDGGTRVIHYSPETYEPII